MVDKNPCGCDNGVLIQGIGPTNSAAKPTAGNVYGHLIAKPKLSTESLVSTWMGDRLGIPGAVGFFTYGFPCTFVNINHAGKKRGYLNDKGHILIFLRS